MRTTLDDHRDAIGDAYRALRMATTVIVTEPGAEPLTAAEVRDHLRRGDDTTEDTYLERLLKAARRKVEEDTGRALITQTHDLVHTTPPDGRLLFLPKPPLQEVTSVTTYDLDDAATVLSSSSYIVDTSAAPGRLTVKSTATWPPATSFRDARALIVRFVAGYGDAAADIPEPLVQAMLLLIGSYYEHREQVLIAQFAGQFIELPRGYRSLIAPYCVKT